MIEEQGTLNKPFRGFLLFMANEVKLTTPVLWCGCCEVKRQRCYSGVETFFHLPLLYVGGLRFGGGGVEK